MEALTQGKLLEADRANVAATFPFYSRLSTIYWVLLWAAMCSVKFSFLFFFKKLIFGLNRTIKIWWWAVFAFTVLTFTYGFIGIVVICPSNNLVSAGMSLLLPRSLPFRYQLSIAPFQTEL